MWSFASDLNLDELNERDLKTEEIFVNEYFVTTAPRCGMNSIIVSKFASKIMIYKGYFLNA